MSRFLRSLAFAATVVAASTASAQPPSPPPGSLDTWVDACHVTQPDLQALLAHNAMVVPRQSVTWNPDDGTFNLLHEPFDELFDTLPVPIELCSNSRFYGQKRVRDFPFRSAFRVGPDLVLTGWHSAFDPGAIDDYYVVFGLQATNVGGQCVEAAFEHIPASQLFSIVEVVADGFVVQDPPLDMLLLRLDREVGGSYPRIRRSGQGRPGDSVTGIGHPERMAAKVDLEGTAGGMTTVAHNREALLLANLHRLNMSSGSMVYNRTQEILEAVAVSGLGATDYEPVGPDCSVLTHVNGFRPAGASLRYFAQFIPAFELIVDFLDPVLHVGTVGGGVTNASSSRTVRAPQTAAGPLSYQIVPPPPFTPGQPTLTIAMDGSPTGTLGPGQSLTIEQSVHTHGVSCGTYERSYEVRDLTNGFQDVARHRFEIGISEFTVSGQLVRGNEDLAPPFEDTDVYTLTNPRPDPVTVVVTANQAWVTLNGVAGQGGAPPSIEVVLPPDSTALVTLGVAASIQQTGYGPHLATATFAFGPGSPCPAFQQPITRTFDFYYGRETFLATLPAPAYIPGAPGLTVSLNVPETFCVGDLNVQITTEEVPASRVTATLTSPLPIAQTIWNQGTLTPPTAPLVALLDDEAEDPPFPYRPLDVFDDQAGGGQWLLNLFDNQPWTEGGSLTSWFLQFHACGAVP